MGVVTSLGYEKYGRRSRLYSLSAWWIGSSRSWRKQSRTAAALGSLLQLPDLDVNLRVELQPRALGH